MVQEALDTTVSFFGSYFSSFTPITYMGASAEGALMTTFLAPPFRWAEACAGTAQDRQQQAMRHLCNALQNAQCDNTHAL